jgi:hypothetical protein
VDFRDSVVAQQGHGALRGHSRFGDQRVHDLSLVAVGAKDQAAPHKVLRESLEIGVWLTAMGVDEDRPDLGVRARVGQRLIRKEDEPFRPPGNAQTDATRRLGRRNAKVVCEAVLARPARLERDCLGNRQIT